MKMFKIEKMYSYLKTSEFIFPEIIICPQNIFRDELEFMAFIILNPWFCQKYGISNIIRNANSTPDIIADIIGFGNKINIEIEYDALNFREHGYFTNSIDLIISFIRTEKSNIINNIPVWSMYCKERKKTGKLMSFIYTLDNDVNCDFDNLRKINSNKLYLENLPIFVK